MDQKNIPLKILDDKTKNIIIISDDEEVVLNLLGSQVILFGYKPILILNGLEVPKIFEENKDKVVCIILDYQLRLTTGIKLSVILREIDPNVKIILISGYCFDNCLSEYTEYKINSFLQKPFTMYELKTKIEEVVNKIE